MVDKKISELVEATTTDGTEFFPVVQAGLSKKLSTAFFMAPPVAADNIIYVGRGSNASDSNNGLSPGRPKATVKAACEALPNGGVVQMLAGTFTLTFAAHPADSSFQVGVVVFSKTTLRGLGSSTIVKVADNQPTGYAFLNRQLTGGDEDIVFEDFVLDGNNVNQGSVTHYGIGLIRTRGCKHNRVTAKNLRGTGTSGSTENFFFETQLSGDTTYNDCAAVRTAGSSSSGFSANGSTGIIYARCRSWGMSVGNGFTHNACRDMEYVSCRAFLNGNHGINSELSSHVRVIGGVFGGRGVVSSSTPFPYTTNQVLGNTGAGVVINGSTSVDLVGVTARNNTGGGLYTSNGTSGRVIGGDYSENGYVGLAFTQPQSTSPWAIMGKPRVVGNTGAQSDVNPVGYSNLGGVLATPAIPGDGVSYVNPYPFDVVVYITGGAWGFIQIDTANVGVTSGAFPLRAGGAIILNYQAAPTWIWIGAAA